VRVAPPRELLEFLDAQGYEVCFCRQGDLVPRGGATHTVRKELPGHGKDYHREGYGTPVGPIKNLKIGDLKLNHPTELIFESEVRITGKLIASTPAVLSFADATCTYKDQTLFVPEWGTYDIVIADNVTSVFSGPADRATYGEVDDFVASRVTPPCYTDRQKKIFGFYSKIRQLRDSKNFTGSEIESLFNEIKSTSANEWLLFLELFEMAVLKNLDSVIAKLDSYLKSLAVQNKNSQSQIESGLKLAHEKY
ncbi:MAG: hypothetical protein ACXVAX_04865, partial [Pseudobdellovibrio sp.]